MVVTQPNKQLRWIIKFGNPNTTVWKFKNNILYMLHENPNKLQEHHFSKWFFF